MSETQNSQNENQNNTSVPENVMETLMHDRPTECHAPIECEEEAYNSPESNQRIWGDRGYRRERRYYTKDYRFQSKYNYSNINPEQIAEITRFAQTVAIDIVKTSMRRYYHEMNRAFREIIGTCELDFFAEYQKILEETCEEAVYQIEDAICEKVKNRVNNT